LRLVRKVCPWMKLLSVSGTGILKGGGRVVRVRSSVRSGVKSAASPMSISASKQLLLVAIVVMLAKAKRGSELNKVFVLQEF